MRGYAGALLVPPSDRAALSQAIHQLRTGAAIDLALRA